MPCKCEKFRMVLDVISEKIDKKENPILELTYNEFFDLLKIVGDTTKIFLEDKNSKEGI